MKHMHFEYGSYCDGLNIIVPIQLAGDVVCNHCSVVVDGEDGTEKKDHLSLCCAFILLKLNVAWCDVTYRVFAPMLTDDWFSKRNNTKFQLNGGIIK